MERSLSCLPLAEHDVLELGMAGHGAYLMRNRLDIAGPAAARFKGCERRVANPGQLQPGFSRPPTRTGSMRVARPFAFVSTNTPHKRGRARGGREARRDIFW